ncbi:hypothetical protein FA15DRAFT_570423, partial [Coprinopsis marcescibilis]
MQTGTRLRRLFATILVFCAPLQPNELWEEFWVKICNDIPLQLRQFGYAQPVQANVRDYGLY